MGGFLNPAARGSGADPERMAIRASVAIISGLPNELSMGRNLRQKGVMEAGIASPWTKTSPEPRTRRLAGITLNGDAQGRDI